MFSKLRAKIRENKGRKNEYAQWALRSYAGPSPSDIKRAILTRYGSPETIWVETGTFMGDTAALLAEQSKQVHTIEPEPTLFERAHARFVGNPKINVIKGLSETIFPQLLPQLSGKVCFWLDGHYSGGITHQGPTDCPVQEELRLIQENKQRFDHLTVMIDDIRCFDPRIPEYADYPPLDDLVDWARTNRLTWRIEHDIFIAQNV